PRPRRTAPGCRCATDPPPGEPPLGRTNSTWCTCPETSWRLTLPTRLAEGGVPLSFGYDQGLWGGLLHAGPQPGELQRGFGFAGGDDLEQSVVSDALGGLADDG